METKKTKCVYCKKLLTGGRDYNVEYEGKTYHHSCFHKKLKSKNKNG